jgi:hypothetical protein
LLAPWRVVAAITLGRGTRHAIEAALAMWYGDRAVAAFQYYGATGAGVVMGVITLGGLAAWLWHARRRRA